MKRFGILLTTITIGVSGALIAAPVLLGHKLHQTYGQTDANNIPQPEPGKPIPPTRPLEENYQENIDKITEQTIEVKNDRISQQAFNNINENNLLQFISINNNVKYQDQLNVYDFQKNNNNITFRLGYHFNGNTYFSQPLTISFDIETTPTPPQPDIPQPDPTYSVNINNLNNNYELFESQQLSASLSPNKDNAYYEWVNNDQDLVFVDNHTDNITFSTKVIKSYPITLNVYEDNSKAKLLTSKTFNINANHMYGYEVENNENTFNFITTNTAVDLDNELATIKPKVMKKLNQTNLKEYLDAWVQQYAQDIVVSRSNTVTSNIVNNTLSVNPDLSINGEVKIRFTWVRDMAALLVPEKRTTGDVEEHTYIFNNAQVEPFIDYSVNNKLAFKINANQFQRKVTSTAPNVTNYNVAFTDQTVLLSPLDELSITFNNSLFNINPIDYLETSYSYQRANNEEKTFIKEVLFKLLHRDVQMMVAGENPIKNSYLTSPLFKLNLSKNYNVSNATLEVVAQDLFPLFYFMNSSRAGLVKRGTTLYIACTGTIVHNVQPTSSKPLVDVNTGIKYDKSYVGFKNLYNWFDDLPLIKTTLINNVKNQIPGNDWNSYVNSLSDTQKAEKIYEFILPFVSYGMQGAETGNSLGYINKRLLCEGYASIFRYVGSTLKTTSLLVTGSVKANAVPGQTAEGKHAWNLIKVDNTWLWCDPTWDDSILSTSPTYNKDNFMKTSAEFFTAESHLGVDNWANGTLLPISIKSL